MSDLVKACRAEVERSEIHGTLEASYLLKEAADRIEDQEADLQRIHKEAVDRYERIVGLEAALDEARKDYEGLLQFVTRYSWSKPDLTPMEAFNAIAHRPDVVERRNEWQRIAQANNNQHTLSKLRPRATQPDGGSE